MKRSFLLIILFLAGNLLVAQKPDKLENYFNTLYKNKQFNGNVLVAEKGKVIFEKSLGIADMSTGRWHNSITSFPIASITKSFVSVGILQLMEQGKLKLDDPVGLYLDGFPYQNVTIKQMLSHTSGLPQRNRIFELFMSKHLGRVFTNADIMPTLNSEKIPLDFNPGEGFDYNNMNFNLLVLVIEKLSGLSFKDYLDKYIYKPAGLTSTSLSNFYRREDENFCERYQPTAYFLDDYARADTMARNMHMFRFNLHGHGDIISNTRDLLKYSIALQNGKLLKKTSLDLLFTPVALKTGKINAENYSLGLIIEQDDKYGKIVWHDGILPGCRSILYMNITTGQTIIMVDNMNHDAVPYARDVMKILHNGKVKPPLLSGAKAIYSSLSNKTKEIKAITAAIQADSKKYYLSEEELNLLGYTLLGEGRNDKALYIFELNTSLFPQSWNVFDSYGEALLSLGRKDEAINMYRKSIALNPDNKNGKKVLEQMGVL